MRGRPRWHPAPYAWVDLKNVPRTRPIITDVYLVPPSASFRH